jgi:hypothetical protein
MPVPGGFGEPTLDYLGCFRGHAFAIEAKRPGGAPTERQRGTIARMIAAGMQVFVINDEVSLDDFSRWLERIDSRYQQWT